MSAKERRVLSAREAAEYLGISLTTLRKIERRGELAPFRTPGGHRRYSVAMLEALFRRTQQEQDDEQVPDR